MCPDQSKSRPICTECKQRPVMLSGKHRDGSIRYKTKCGTCDWKKRRERQEARLKAKQEARDAKVMEEVQSGMDALLEKHQDEVASLTVRLAESEQDLAGVRSDLGRQLEESEAAVARQKGIVADLRRKLDSLASVSIRDSNRAQEMERMVQVKLEELDQSMARVMQLEEEVEESKRQFRVACKQYDNLQVEVQQRRNREIDLVSRLEAYDSQMKVLNDSLDRANDIASKSARDLSKANDHIELLNADVDRLAQLRRDAEQALEEMEQGFLGLNCSMESAVAKLQSKELELSAVCRSYRKNLRTMKVVILLCNLGWLAAWILV